MDIASEKTVEMKWFGPAKICKQLKAMNAIGGKYEFEAKSMPNVCGTE